MNFIKKIGILIIFLIFPIFIFASSNDKYEKGKITEILRTISANKDEVENGISKKIKVIVEIKTGDYKNKKVLIMHPVFKDKAYNVPIKRNEDVVLDIHNQDGMITYNIIDIDKRGLMISILLIFIFLVIVIGKGKGVKALMGIAISIFFIFYGMLPLILKGYSPLWLGVIFSFLIALFTIYFVAGDSKKGLVAFLGTIGGTIIAGVLSQIYIYAMKLTGYTDLESIYASNLFKNVNVVELISAGIIIGSLGAVMDTAISIASSLNEIREHNNQLTEKQILKSGMKIGKDVIGTMVNTLILAYIGSSMFTILMFMVQKNDYPLIRILNFEFISTEFLRSIAGSIGILIAVPLTAYFGSKIFTKKIKKK
ncbi:YibE/F family protein [Haliovirga abyssi]|uniref:Transporter n=1 Tax=Haliovirga abyssi TaxID=2996794 RepID=A0AAU9D437_9FUSO|nr:YibE/F family protein [Haliovirga abyssi]BDU50741.1 transporter [Haliovirga abyssi]